MLTLVEYMCKYVLGIYVWLFEMHVLTSCFYLICELWTLRQSVFKLQQGREVMKRNSHFFVFPLSKFIIVLRTQQMTTGCELNQVVPLNKGILAVVEIFTSHYPVHMSPYAEKNSVL